MPKIPKDILILLPFLLLIILILALTNIIKIAKNSSTEPYFTPPKNTASPKLQKEPQVNPIIENSLSGLAGRYAVYVKDLKTQKTYQYKSNEIFGSASIYKLAVMYKAYDAIENNELSKEEAKEPLRLMITISDNDSAILLAERLTWQKIDAFMESEGFIDFNLVGENSPSVTAKTAGDLLERIYSGKTVNPAASEEMKSLLFAQTVNDRIPKYLPTDIKVGHKTGELDTLRHDAGIVLGKKNHYIFVFLSDTKKPNDGTETIAQLSKKIFDELENN
ncbi:hypothetical protein A2165_02885 [Candidatus Curtissbacteria bacterium RBG_13_40_7]|uniref:Beta-lactamase class A catalytic domain-containing protein n=1 Tax=Candidatus Curtissbacteria bacterium RBG_13_40_7 TaxID=1797706 RepID=A0A1F5FX27_9BACT|nr:MAG: hypothetical protein A2165_02885 [Candidatus Curtissbacteria bacterium RBG_13_40_7]